MTRSSDELALLHSRGDTARFPTSSRPRSSRCARTCPPHAMPWAHVGSFRRSISICCGTPGTGRVPNQPAKWRAMARTIAASEPHWSHGPTGWIHESRPPRFKR